MDQQSTDIAKMFELVTGIQIRSRRSIESGLRVRGLTYAQYSALVALAARNGMSQAELAQALDTDSTTAMVLRTSLEKKGLVNRVDDPEDGRVKRIVISDAGRAALQGANPEARSLYAKVAGLVSESEVKKLLPILEKIHVYLGELVAPKKDSDEPKRLGRPRKADTAKPARAAKAVKAGRAAKSAAKPKAPVKTGRPKAAAKAKPAPKAAAPKVKGKAKAAPKKAK